MNNKKYITTTLPYINSEPHIGHCFEFLLADLIASYFRYNLGKENVFFNLGVDEHGQKIFQKAIADGYKSTQEYCDKYADIWKSFCSEFNVDYDNFYRTTSDKHKEQVVKFYEGIKSDLHKKNYSGRYCVGCEAFITEKEIEYPNNCPIHKTPLLAVSEENIFFDLNKYSSQIKDTLIDKSLSNELANIIKEDYDLSITRKNVTWGVKSPDGDTYYVWADALLNYIFAIKYYEDKAYFDEFWSDSLQICGKDNLKFQSYIFQALLIAAGIPQTKEVLVHGMILDEKGQKMSKSIGNVVSPVEQKEKFGLLPLKYYLLFGLHTFKNSKYSEKDLLELWNADIANGIGNVITRSLHIIDSRQVKIDRSLVDSTFINKLFNKYNEIDFCFKSYDFQGVRNNLNAVIAEINLRIQNEKPYDKDSTNYEQVLNEIYFQLESILPFYQIIFKEKKDELEKAFIENKKVILFEKLNAKLLLNNEGK